MTTIHLICALVTLALWAKAKYTEYLEGQKLFISLEETGIIIALMAAGLYGLIVTLIVAAAKKWKFLKERGFYIYKDKSKDEPEGE